MPVGIPNGNPRTAIFRGGCNIDRPLDGRFFQAGGKPWLNAKASSCPKVFDRTLRLKNGEIRPPIRPVQSDINPPRSPLQDEKNSTSGICENAPHIGLHPCLRPVGMLGAQSGSLHLARRPVKTLGRPQSILAGHGAKDLNLFRTRLFIRQHGLSMPRRGLPRKQKAS
jgi:hypothetical protein